MSEDIKRTYDQYWAPGGFQPPANSNPFLEEQVGRFGKPGIRVADLGCGDARTLGDRFKGSGADYVGADVSRSAVESAGARGLDVRLIDDISATGLPSGEFDAVFVIEVLEHLLDPLAAVEEARRLLRPGGTLAVTCPNAALWTRRAELLLLGRTNAMGDDLSRTEPWRDPHIRWFTLPTLEALLRQGGFQDVTVGGEEPTFPVERLAVTLMRRRPTLFARRCTALAVAPS